MVTNKQSHHFTSIYLWTSNLLSLHSRKQKDTEIFSAFLWCDAATHFFFFFFCQVHVMERLHWNSQSSQPWSWTVIACQIRVQSPLVTPVKLYTQEAWLLISLSITHHRALCVGGQGRSTYPLWHDWLGQLHYQQGTVTGLAGLLRVCPAEIAMLRSENLSRTTGMPVSCTICASKIGRGVKRLLNPTHNFHWWELLYYSPGSHHRSQDFVSLVFFPVMMRRMVTWPGCALLARRPNATDLLIHSRVIWINIVIATLNSKAGHIPCIAV